jgi:hypothetical protein
MPPLLILRNSLIPFLCIFICGVQIFAQQQTPTLVKGRVTDEVTKEPLPFVNLKFKGTTVGTITDDSGRYEIKILRKVDSLHVSFVGYTSQYVKVKPGVTQTINIALKPGNVALGAVEVKYKGNPAELLLNKILDKKPINNPQHEKGLSYEAYNKLEFDIYNFGEKIKTRKFLKPVNFIFDYMDSTDKDNKPHLPVLLAEKLSTYYVKNPPLTRKEYIIGSRLTGVNNESVKLIIDDTYQNINIYDNTILVWNKTFPSPLSTSGLFYYKYYLNDSANIDGKWCYTLEFVARRKGELMFNGYLIIHDTTYAVKSAYLKMNDGININFLKDFQIRQEFELINNRWSLVKEKSFSNIVPFDDNAQGIFIRKTTSYRDYNYNISPDLKVFSTPDKIIRNDSVDIRDEKFWQSARHDSLSKSEQGIISMVDTVKKTMLYKIFYKLGYTATTGFVPLWYVELGQFYKVISFNKIEGTRYRLGIRTTKKTSTRIRLDAYGAIGNHDKMFKGGGGFQFHVNRRHRMPWNVISGHYEFDLVQLGSSDRRIWAPDNLLASIARRRPQDKLVLQRELWINHEHDWFTGFMTNFQVAYRRFYGINQRYPFERLRSDGSIDKLKYLSNAEISLSVNYTFGEKYFIREFERISLNRRFPVFGFDLIVSVPGILGSDYSYQHTRLSITQRRLAMGPLGYGEYRIEAGKVFGKAPWLFLEIHRGNETYSNDRYSFNMMNLLEFVSDQYVALYYTQHFDGILFNKIPGLKKLKWREVGSFRWAAGSMNKHNRNELIMPMGVSPMQGPYMEASVGIENIFKLFRIDACWRLTQRNKPEISRFGVRFAVQVLF